MNRQMKRRMNKSLNLKSQDIDNLSEHFRRENEERERAIVMQFLSLTVEALRMEFGFGQKRIEKYMLKVNSLLDDMDLMSEVFIDPAKVLKLNDEAIAKINKKLKKGDKNEA